jgi:Uri superfamily endonuclease
MAIIERFTSSPLAFKNYNMLTMASPSQANQLELPRQLGTYALIYSLGSECRIRVGKLGTHTFPAGFYVYIGSALGPGGLAGRIYRHIGRSSSAGSQHWHIDYLAAKASLLELWTYSNPARREHTWAETLKGLDGALIPVPRFGASDCQCPSHLFLFRSKPDREKFNHLLSLRRPGEPMVACRSITNI